MAIHYTTWSPDTCGCSVTYQWDDTVDPSVRTHTFYRQDRKCPIHAAVQDGDSLLQLVWDENRRKNLTASLATALGNLPSEGQLPWFSWSFNANRALEVTINTTITAQKKTQIQNACDLQFGPGKVVIL